MIRLRPVTEADWTAAQLWIPPTVSPLAVRRRLPRVWTPALGDTYQTAEDDGTLVAVVGACDMARLPPRTAGLELYVSPDYADPAAIEQWTMHAVLMPFVAWVFAELGVTRLVAQVPRNPDYPLVYKAWPWLADRIVRDLGTAIIASGGWHFLSDGTGPVINPDKATPMHLEWMRR